MTDHFVEVPKKVLSPAAEAVAWAYDNAPERPVGNHRYRGIAAALRAAADQDPYGLNTGEYDEGWYEAMATVIAIATELEGQ